MTPNFVASACRSCRYYTPEGRRGGSCQQLGVPVRGNWQACSLAIPVFASTRENLEQLLTWQKEIVILGEVLPLEGSLDSSLQDASQAKSASTVKTGSTQPVPV